MIQRGGGALRYRIVRLSDCRIMAVDLMRISVFLWLASGSDIRILLAYRITDLTDPGLFESLVWISDLFPAVWFIFTQKPFIMVFRILLKISSDYSTDRRGPQRPPSKLTD